MTNRAHHPVFAAGHVQRGDAFEASETFATTRVSLDENDWLGAGFTWRFGSGGSAAGG